MRLGGLCSGVGGLELAVEQAFGCELAWCSEIDPAASRVLDARFAVPNLGDFRDATPEPVDVLCAGFPCQPVSTAGKRAGLTDERWLFDDIADFVGRMDPPPRLLVFENVPGLLTANNGDALARVVHRLAGLGYVGRWRLLRAADVGAPHRRERWFCVAAHGASGRRGWWQKCDESALGGWHRLSAERGEGGRVATRDSDTAADACGSGAWRDSGGLPPTVEGARRAGNDVHAAVDARPAPADTDGVAGAAGFAVDRRPRAVDEPRAVERAERLHRLAHEGGELDADATEVPSQIALAGRQGHQACSAAWGPYAPAVQRWANILGRCAPPPVDDKRRLNPRAVEFMMGFADGWVCDVLERRTDVLRCLGNAVVQQQAVEALRRLSTQGAPQ